MRIVKSNVPLLSVFLYVYICSPRPIKSFPSQLTPTFSLNFKLYGGNHIILPPSGPCCSFVKTGFPVSSTFALTLTSFHARFSIENIHLLIKSLWSMLLSPLNVSYGAISGKPLSCNDDISLSLWCPLFGLNPSLNLLWVSAIVLNPALVTNGLILSDIFEYWWCEVHTRQYGLS